MAAVALNTFITVRHSATPQQVGIYTAPVGVAAIVLFAQAVNEDPDGTVHFVSLGHARPSAFPENPVVFNVAENVPVIRQDTLNLLNGRLVLETGDELRVSGDTTGDVKVVFSILETAKS